MNNPPIGRTLTRVIEFEGHELLIHYNYQKSYNHEGTKMIGYDCLLESIDLSHRLLDKYSHAELGDIQNKIHELDFDEVAENQTI
ncbi:MAG: hypothetical protein JWQ09_4411 [Segetibacter sp.]|nr:hypothetical protein [Segetibacter sp.]